MKSNSIVFRFMAPCMALVVLSFLALGAFTAWSKASSMSEMFRRKVELSGSLSKDGAGGGLWELDDVAMKANLAPILNDKDVKLVQVTDAKGQTFFTSGDADLKDAATKALGGDAVAKKETVVNAGGYMMSVVPLVHTENNDSVPLGSMVIVYSTASVTSAVWSAVLTVVGIVAVAVTLIAAAMMYLLRTNITVALNELGSAMTSLSRGMLDTQVRNLDRKDEIGVMARAVQVFKENAQQLKLSEEERGRLSETTERQRAESERERIETAAHQSQVVESLAEGLERLSQGDLTFRLTQQFAPAYEKLRADYNAAVEKLSDSMSVLLSSVGVIRTGAQQITSAADDLSQRTEQQAASLEEAAAALDEITATVRHSAQGATHAREVVGTAKSDVERSREVVREAVDAMSGIEGFSHQISQIVGVIDEIAFQTNLLALNAGVEAARAGESGKGFAVVASEVRALAQRSAEAAKEIKVLISSSGEQVNLGVKLVGQTGAALETIVSKVNEISELVSDMATAAQEQMSSITEVNSAVTQMDQVTQRNAAMVEESTAASHGLAAETHKLSELVSLFNVGDVVQHAQAGAPARPRSRRTNARAPTYEIERGGAVRVTQAEAENGWEEF